MASRRHAGFRQGDLAEELGLFLLRGLSFVAPVDRIDDFGLDAIATLFRRDRAMLIAEESFYVQIKAASVRAIEYVGQQATWLRGLELPFFIGRVNLEHSSIELFSTHSASQVFTQPLNHKVRLVFGEGSQKRPPLITDIPLGKPVLRWSIDQLRQEEFLCQAYKVMKEWIRIERLNIKLRSTGYTEMLTWTTDEIPESQGIGLTNSVNDDTAQFVLREMIPYLKVYYNDCRWKRRLDDARVIQDLLKMMRNRGVEPDTSDGRNFPSLDRIHRERYPIGSPAKMDADSDQVE